MGCCTTCPYSESPGEAAPWWVPCWSGVLAGGHGDSVSLVPGGLGGTDPFLRRLVLHGGGRGILLGDSPWFLKLGYFMADIVTFLLGILTFPLALGRAVLKKFGKLAKNTFLSGVKWYRIGQKTEEMERAVPPTSPPGREERMSMKLKRAGFLTKIVVLALLIYMATSLLDLRGQIQTAQVQRDTLARQVSDQRLENQELEAAIENSDDPEMLEQVAREKGHVKQDEIVYIDVAN